VFSRIEVTTRTVVLNDDEDDDDDDDDVLQLLYLLCCMSDCRYNDGQCSVDASCWSPMSIWL